MPSCIIDATWLFASFKEIPRSACLSVMQLTSAVCGASLTNKERTLRGVCAALLDKEAAAAAALALRHLCDACGAAMAPHLDVLMALYQRMQSPGHASTSASATGGGGGAPSHAAVEEADAQQVRSARTDTFKSCAHHGDAIAVFRGQAC